MDSPESFDTQIYRLVAQIPRGRVISYGRLAVLAGKPGLARRVGRALANAPPNLPCHRVVNSKGRLAPGFSEQKGRLLAEGITFLPSGHVDMKRHRI